MQFEHMPTIIGMKRANDVPDERVERRDVNMNCCWIFFPPQI